MKSAFSSECNIEQLLSWGVIDMFFTSENLVGEFAHKVASLKEQLGNQLLSVVESFRKKNTEMKRDRYRW